MKVTDVRFVAGVTDVAQLPKDERPQIAFIGRSNVGKSSLLNALVGRKGIARVSKTPGRTQQVNFFVVNERFYLVDLPGYGFADVPKAVQKQFLALVESYLAGAAALRLLLVLLDCRRDPSGHDFELLAWLRQNGVAHAVVLTKTDKLSRSQLLQRQREISQLLAAGGATGLELVPFSAVTGNGRQELWAVIVAAALEPARRRAAGPAPESRDSLGNADDLS